MELRPTDEDQDLRPVEKGRSIAPTPVKPVANAFAILRFMASRTKPVRATDVARTLSINPSTCFNILRTLTAEKVVDFDEQSKTYSIGYGLYALVSSGPNEARRLAAARNAILDFALQHGVTSTLWRRIGKDRMVLECVEYSADGIRVHMPTGQRLPVLTGATGRAVAIRLGVTKEKARAEFSNLRWERPLDFETYWRDAELAVDRGWALDDGYFSQGVVSLASPVFDATGKLTHSFIAVSIREQFTAEELEALGAAMTPVAQELARILN